MEENKINQLLEELKNKEKKELKVSKEEFLVVREVLVKRNDFKHFRGVAKHGGEVIYQYLDEARS